MGDVDPHAWFDAEELEMCRTCGERATIPLPSASSCLCLACGSVHESQDEPARNDS
jgi:hypothetical protein